jgi:hypothetical protein
MTVFEGKTRKQYLFILHFILKKKVAPKNQNRELFFFCVLERLGGWLRKTKISLNVPYLIYHIVVNMSSEKSKKV